MRPPLGGSTFVTVIPDPEADAIGAAFITAASRLELHGDVLRGRVALIARQRDAMRWQSPAARACRARIEAALHHLLTTSSRLTLAADDLRRAAARLTR